MEDNIIILIQKFLQGNISSEELQQLQRYYDLNLIKEEVLTDYYQQQWDLAEKTSQDEDNHKKIAWSKFQEQFEERTPDFKIKSKKWMQVAAAAIFVILLTGIGYFQLQNNIKPQTHFSVIVENGQKSKVILSDGTVAFLNSSSELICLSGYGKKDRNVFLTGEAYFDVKSNPQKPFVVNTIDKLKIQALGTKFNVKSYPNDSHVISTLIEGKISVEKDEIKYDLLPNEMVLFDKQTNQLRKSSIQMQEEALGWLSNHFIFNSETLENIANILERTYNINVIFESEDIKNIKYTGNIKNSSLDNVLALMTITAPIEYIARDSLIIIKKTKSKNFIK